MKNKALFEVIGQGQSVVAKVAEMEKVYLVRNLNLVF